MSIVSRFGTKEPTCCAVCRRRAWWLGYSPSQGQTIIWLCDSNECHALGKVVYKMPTNRLDQYEKAAAVEAGNEGGAFLDELGVTDLAKLTEGQYGEYLRRVIVGFERSLRTMILSGAAPF